MCEVEGMPVAEGGSLGLHSALLLAPWGSGQVYSPTPAPAPGLSLLSCVRRQKGMPSAPSGMPDYEDILKRINTGVITN